MDIIEHHNNALSNDTQLFALFEHMDVSDLAQMMPKRFAGKNILKGYKHIVSALWADSDGPGDAGRCRKI